MNRTLFHPALLAVALTLAACGQPAAQEPADAPAAASAAVTFTAKPSLSPTAEALPRLTGEVAPIAAINADLDRIDAMDAANIAECTGGGWNRSIQKPMTGPDYVALRIAQDYYCGGAYPDTSQTVVTWDLSTGQRVDWSAALPGLNLTADSLDDMPAGYVGNVRSAALGAWWSARMLANPDAEWVEQCRPTFDPESLAGTGFKIWADPENGGVSVTPDFPHVAKACAETATLTTADLRRFNAESRLVTAIEAASAARNWVSDTETAQ